MPLKIINRADSTENLRKSVKDNDFKVCVSFYKSRQRNKIVGR